METLLLPFVALLLEILLIVIFFSNERDDNSETKTYSYLLLVNFIDIIISIASYIYAKKVGDPFVIGLLQKVYMSLLVLLTVYINCYNIKLIKFKPNVEKFLIKAYHLSFFIITIICFLLPLNVVNYGNVLDGHGLAYDVVLISIIMYLASIIIFAIIIFKKNIREFKKNIPFACLIVFYIISIFLRQYFPNVMFENFLFSYIFIIMYFTIENPDLKMLKEVTIAKNQAERSNRAKSDFLSSMSHEIRTPLNAIVGLSEDIASYREKVPKEVVEDTEDIRNASQTLLEIVGNILDINKIEAEKMEIVENPYRLKDEITRMCKVTATRIGDKHIDFKLNIAEDIPYELIGDKVHVKEIINNLLSNSIKYTEQGQINLNVKCVNDYFNNISNIIITCQDTGRGIKSEYINKLFTKFERLDIERNTTAEGTGLGLAITKALVEMMGGKINVQSQFGQGTIFMVQIKQKISKISAPMTEKELLDTAKILYNNKNSSESNLQSTNIGSYAGKRVLVVDDNKLNIKVAIRALKNFDLLLDECNDGQECLNKINSGEKYDLILMDIMMPNMSGETALVELKKNKSFDTPVIALTADAIAGAKEKYINVGFVDYIAKPFSREQIKEKLDLVFANSINEVVQENKSEEVLGQNAIENLKIEEYNENYLLKNGIDYKKGLEILGDLDTYKEMVSDWFKECHSKFEEMRVFKQNKDMSNYAILVHSLKSDSKYFGFNKLAELSYEHELKSKENNLEFINNNFEELEKEFIVIINIIEKYLTR